MVRTAGHSPSAWRLERRALKRHGRPASRLLFLTVAALIGTILIVSLGTVLPAPHPGKALADSPADWPMMGYDPAWTGYNSGETSLTPSLRLAWAYETQGAISGSPAVAGGMLYVGSLDGKLYALDARTGEFRWSFATGGQIWSSPAIANGIVYFGSYDHIVYALNATTGALVWSYQTGDIVFASPVVANGIVYVSSGPSAPMLYALDAETGAARWLRGVRNGWSSAAYGDGVVYLGILNTSEVYAMDGQTGAVKWSDSTQQGYVRSAPSLSGPLLYVPLTGILVARNAQMGNLLWGFSADSAVDSPLATANGLVYMSSRAGTIFALEAQAGGLVWQHQTGEAWSSSPVVANGVVYVGTGWSIHALDAQTGSPQWAYKTGGYIGASLAIAGGMLYVGSEDRKVYAFETSPTLPTPSPTPVPTGTPTVTPTAMPTPSIPNLSLMQVPTEKAYPGEAVGYTILLDNSSTSQISVTLTDTIPANTSYITGTLVGGTYDASTNSVQWSGAVPTGFSSLPSEILSFRVKLDSNISGNTVTNTVLLSNGSITMTSTATTAIWRRTVLPLLPIGSTNW